MDKLFASDPDTEDAVSGADAGGGASPDTGVTCPACGHEFQTRSRPLSPPGGYVLGEFADETAHQQRGHPRGISTTRPHGRASWDALDSLPRPLREILWGAPVLDQSAVGRAARARRRATCADVRWTWAIAEELARFNAPHRRSHGHPLPTVAAGVQPLRYGAAVARTRRRRR